MLRASSFLLASLAIACGAPAPRVAAPRPADVASLDGMIAAYYEIVSGAAGQPRDWPRDETLYLPGTRFVSVQRKDGKILVENVDHDGFVEASDAFLRQGFFEHEIKREQWQWGSLAQVRSSYVTRRTPDGPVLGRGVNTLELVHDGHRWWIAGATWQSESPDLPLPPALDDATR